MANFKALILGGSPIVTKFEFEREKLLSSDLKIRIFKDYTDEWLDFVIANRMGDKVQKFDYVYGPIADDKVGLQLRKYDDEEITKDELMKRLRYMKGITFQYFFGSDEALKYLKVL